MRQKLFDRLSIMSLVLFVATIAVWVGSYSRCRCHKPATVGAEARA